MSKLPPRPTTPSPIPWLEWEDGVTEEDARIITELITGDPPKPPEDKPNDT